MGITKKLNLSNIFLFLFFALFPFGQIIRIGILHPIDIVVGLGGLYAIIKKLPRPEVFEHFNNILFVAAFSWIFSLFIFRQVELAYGLLYLVRLAGYFYFFVYVWNFAKQSQRNIKVLTDSLLTISLVSALFGWIQYFYIPNLKPFFIWGWDDHLFRLTGTFLDPTFLGLIIVLGLTLAIYQFIKLKKKRFIFITLFLLVSLAFTYSRASYVAFLAGAGVIIYHNRNLFRKITYLILGLILLIIILPTSGNNILKITRTFSAISRVENYSETINLFKMSPVFGVGYNNLCLARSEPRGFINFRSHACSGSDSSLLLILTTTGTTGLLIFIYSFFQISKSVSKKPFSKIFNAGFIAVLFHSLFSNSLFYPWIMGYVLILLAISLRGEVEN